MISNDVNNAIADVLEGTRSYCKFLAANDVGKTGSHQAGIYIKKNAFAILFPQPGIKGENKDKWVKIRWQNDFETESRFVYYGRETRNEYRITNFGRNFPFFTPEYTGALLVLTQQDEDAYTGHVLNSEEDIETFLDTFGMSPTETDGLIDVGSVRPEVAEDLAVQAFIDALTEDFPASDIMSCAARQIHEKVHDHSEYIVSNPDRKIIDWVDMEYSLFRALERSRYGERIKQGFSTVDEFVSVANKVLNRRKSRAGKGLEHHLAAIFDGNNLIYSAQAVTEGNKKPDFVFPSIEAYHDSSYSADNLISLASKTTCKDRWRQVLNEADRLKDRHKYLFTLQQGISAAQMDEMQAEGVVLVVPKEYIKTYPKDRRERIWSLKKFVDYVKAVESR